MSGLVRGRWDVVLVVAAGGALGSLARWSVTRALPAGAGDMPWATWVENVSGAFLLAVLMVFVLELWPPGRYVRPFVGVGILGGYTTFSTFMLDTHALLADGHGAMAAGYLGSTLVTGLAAVVAGVMTARTVVNRSGRRGQPPPRRSP
jgi:CrcB protein